MSDHGKFEHISVCIVVYLEVVILRCPVGAAGRRVLENREGFHHSDTLVVSVGIMRPFVNGGGMAAAMDGLLFGLCVHKAWRSIRT